MEQTEKREDREETGENVGKKHGRGRRNKDVAIGAGGETGKKRDDERVRAPP